MGAVHITSTFYSVPYAVSHHWSSQWTDSGRSVDFRVGAHISYSEDEVSILPPLAHLFLAISTDCLLSRLDDLSGVSRKNVVADLDLGLRRTPNSTPYHAAQSAD